MDRQVARKLICLISSNDIEQIGLQTYTLNVKEIKTMQAAQASVAIIPPPTHHCPQCHFRVEKETCNQTWRDFWLTTVPLIVLVPDHPKPLESLIPFSKKVNIKNFHDTCK